MDGSLVDDQGEARTGAVLHRSGQLSSAFRVSAGGDHVGVRSQLRLLELSFRVSSGVPC